MGRIFLAMNGKRINTLDDLRANFNPDQILSFYRSGRLQKWLEECGATEELENINGLEAGYDEATLLSMIMAVFELSDEQIQAVEAIRKKQEQVEETSQESVSESKEAEDDEEAEEDEDDEEAEEDEDDEEAQEDEEDEEDEEEDKEEEYEIKWNVCQLPQSVLKLNNIKVFEATTEEISIENLSKNKIITGSTQQNFLSKSFFFDGYFWAKLCENGPYDEVWGKGKDGIHWTIDNELNNLINENCIGIEHIKVTNTCVFLMAHTHSGLETKYLIYKSDKGWKLGSLPMDSMMNSSEYESHLEDLFADDGYYGIVGVHCWETGIFSKEYHWSHKLFISDKLPSSSTSDFKELFYFSNYESSDVRAYVFKERLFVLAEAYDSNFSYAELDAENPDFHSLQDLDGVVVKTDDKVFTFKDAMFIVSKIDKYTSDEDRHKPVFTADGLEWKECEIDSDKVIDIVYDGALYYAICEGEKNGHATIYFSETGETWEELQDIVFSIGENENVAVAGNDALILFNGSTTGKYILYSCRKASNSMFDPVQYATVGVDILNKIQNIIAKELDIRPETIDVNMDLYSDLKLEEWRVRILSFIIGDAFGIKFQENEMPTQIVDIVNLIAAKHFNGK